MNSSQDKSEVINLIVGGFYYSLDPRDLEHFPECYFSHFLKDEWTRDRSAVIQIDRDGRLFRYISSFINVGVFERGCDGPYTLELYLAIRREADFFNLPSMVDWCDYNILMRMEYHENYMGNITSATASAPYPLHLFHCESDFAEPSALQTALNAKFRPAVAAATSITITTPLPDLRPSSLYRVHDESCYDCYDITRSFAQTLGEICEKPNTWPLQCNKASQLSNMEHNVYLYSTGGYCTQRRHLFYNHGYKFVGSIVYIHSACVYTGGKITATACGQTLSINKPGECMAMAAGAQYSVETVTSGELVIVEMHVVEMSDDHEEDIASSDGDVDASDAFETSDAGSEAAHTTTQRLQWPVHSTSLRDSSCDEDGTQYAALVTALNTELVDYTGVVLCLTHYYPVTHSPDPDNNHLYTDPDLLKGLDKALYTMLLEKGYDVSLVTVYVGRCTTNASNTYNHTEPDSFASSSGADSSALTTTGCIVDSIILPDVEGAKYKIIPVVYGYGKTFTRGGGKQVGTIVTGVLVTGMN